MFNVISIRIDYRTNLWRDSDVSCVGQPSIPDGYPTGAASGTPPPAPSSVTQGILSLATRHAPVIQVERIRIGQKTRSVLLCSSKTALVNKMHGLFCSFLMFIRFYLQYTRIDVLPLTNLLL